jgi:RNA polymerase sigma factor (sigma-70 family)
VWCGGHSVKSAPGRCVEEHRCVVTAGTASRACPAALCSRCLVERQALAVTVTESYMYQPGFLWRNTGTATKQLSVKLVHQAMVGDEQAWKELVKQYGGLLRIIAKKFRLTPEQAADAAQTTWLQLVQNISKVREPEKLGGWLASTMRRECIRLINDRRHQQLTEGWTVECPSSVERPSISESPDVQLLLAERNVLLWSAVDRLPARQRQVLAALSTTPTPSYEEISTALSIARGSIGPTRQRALRRMRGMLAGSGGVRRSCG